MFERLLGLETEYALRFIPEEPGTKPPAKRLIYDAVMAVVRERMATTSPAMLDYDATEFLQNGAALSFEHAPYATEESGLIEGATPEHPSPSTILLYQRALDRLLATSAKAASRGLGVMGHRGELRIIKNCRDAQGEVYGVQENYEVEFARGPWLWLWRIGWALLLPVCIVSPLLVIALIIALAIALLPLLIVVRIAHDLPDTALGRAWRRLREGPGPKIVIGFELVLSFIPAQLVTTWMWFTCFRHFKRDLTGFLVSRPLISGAGTLDGDDFLLSEKGTVIKRICRATLLPVDRAIFDTGNLLSDTQSSARFTLRPLFRLFHKRQRMQLGLADANLCDVAEYLKVGLTALAVDAVEAGALKNVARPKRPVRALKTWSRDPRALVPCSGGLSLSAHAMQRAVLNATDAWVREHPAPKLEAQELLRIWREVLDLLDDDEDALVGRLDWVTKRYLLRRIGAGKAWAVRKKIDIRYHELQSGYHAELAAAGLVTRLVDDEEVERAIADPPDGSPAKIRARFIKDLRYSHEKVVMGWGEVRVGRGRSAQIFRFEDFKDQED